MVPDTKMIRIEFTDDGECLVHFDGMRIAKREDGGLCRVTERLQHPRAACKSRL
jgi:hypothetical protein